MHFQKASKLFRPSGTPYVGTGVWEIHFSLCSRELVMTMVDRIQPNCMQFMKLIFVSRSLQSTLNPFVHRFNPIKINNIHFCSKSMQAQMIYSIFAEFELSVIWTGQSQQIEFNSKFIIEKVEINYFDCLSKRCANNLHWIDSSNYQMTELDDVKVSSNNLQQINCWQLVFSAVLGRCGFRFAHKYGHRFCSVSGQWSVVSKPISVIVTGDRRLATIWTFHYPVIPLQHSALNFYVKH